MLCGLQFFKLIFWKSHAVAMLRRLQPLTGFDPGSEVSHEGNPDAHRGIAW
jgi:hypothetical protein